MKVAENLEMLWDGDNCSQALRMADSESVQVMEDHGNGERIYKFRDGSMLKVVYCVHSVKSVE